MDGFKDSTKMKYMMGGDVSAYKTGGTVKKAMGGACGPMKKATGGTVKMSEGGTYNERGKRATMAEIAAEDRRMANRKPPVEGVSSRPTDSSGRRASNADLGMAVSAKKPMKKAMGGSVSDKPMMGMPVGYTAKDQQKTVFTGDEPSVTPPTKGSMPSKATPTKGTAKVGNPVTKGPGGPKPAPTKGKPDMYKPNIVPTKGKSDTYEPNLPRGGKPMPGRPPVTTLIKGKPDMYTPRVNRGPSMAPAHSGKPMIGRKAGGLAVMPKGKC